MKVFEAYIDGASRGNPGHAGVGVILKSKGKTIEKISINIGITTNNVAEYMALIYALQAALIHRVDVLNVYTDSELLYNQVCGRYKVKNIGLRPLFQQVKFLKNGLKEFHIRHISRSLNNEADSLATQAAK